MDKERIESGKDRDRASCIPDHIRAQYPDAAFFEYRERFVRHLIDDLAARAGGGRCLDIGCNGGRYTRMLADRGLQASGLDFSADMIRAARRSHPDLNFREGDAQALPFADGEFDAAISLGLIQLLPDWRAAVAEALRVVKPGGVVVIETNRAFPLWELVLKSMCYRVGGTMNAGDARAFRWAHRKSADANWTGILRKFPPGHLCDVARERGASDVVIHDHLKYGMLHDFMFAVTVVKGRGAHGGNAAGRGELEGIRVCGGCRTTWIGF